MPELPEVETVKRVLINIVKGQTIKEVEVFRPRQIDGDVETFKRELKGKTFLDVTRIGKYLIFHFNEELVMISHLRMEGKYFEYLENEANSPYARVVFHLNNGHKICYDDSRTFGILKLSTESTYLKDPQIAKLGPEPFNADYHKIYLANRKNKAKIKTALLDQTIVTGLGNIYVDETLYEANIHPHTPTYLISENEWQKIIVEASKILTKAIELGGSTIKSYHPGKNIDGNFQNEILIYGKKGETCSRCGHTFLFNKTNGRGTTFCPGCQIKKGSPINVGLTGPISSGKSVVIQYFKSKGAEVISSDEIVKQLYKKDEVIKHINNMFHLNFEDEIDHKILRDYLLVNKDSIRKLERYIHPLVRKEIERVISTSKKDIRIVEVPLLFKAHYEDLFDTIICLEISEENQLERLIKRNGNQDGLLLKEINKNNMIEENKNKAEFLVSNNGNLDEFKTELEAIFNKLKYRLN